MNCRYPEWIVALVTATGIISIQLIVFGCFKCINYLKNPPKKGFDLLMDEQYQNETENNKQINTQNDTQNNKVNTTVVPSVYIPSDFNSSINPNQEISANPSTEFFTRTYQEWDLSENYNPDIPNNY